MLSLASILTGGCGETSGHDVEQVCTQTAQLTCERMFSCFSSAALEEFGVPSTRDACVEQNAAQCKGATADTFCGSDETYSPEAADICLDQTHQLPCHGVQPGVYDLRYACLAICIEDPNSDGTTDF